MMTAAVCVIVILSLLLMAIVSAFLRHLKDDTFVLKEYNDTSEMTREIYSRLNDRVVALEKRLEPKAVFKIKPPEHINCRNGNVGVGKEQYTSVESKR